MEKAARQSTFDKLRIEMIKLSNTLLFFNDYVAVNDQIKEIVHTTFLIYLFIYSFKKIEIICFRIINSKWHYLFRLWRNLKKKTWQEYSHASLLFHPR
jgi:hypothetical protein